ncbi:MAG: UDP-glucose/GDP-mannose dehydrogenase family protein [Candidatus Binatia bacterium]
MKVCVVGTGYVGLVAGTCFAEGGNDVICVDSVAEKIDALRQGKVPIYEPGLEELIRRNVAEGRLAFSTDLPAAVRKSLVCFVAVGTPSGDDGAADLSAVWAVGKAIAQAMDGYRVVVTKSTVPVGTAAKLREVVAANTSHPFDVVSNPEFMKEGAAIEDFMKPDRVVIGGTSQRALDVMHQLYDPFVRTGAPILTMDNASAEMTKYAGNALLATRISFMNEIANLCERVGADVEFVRRGIGYDRRIGHHFLFPGVGYGGSCFPKDVKAVIHTAHENGMTFPLLNAVEEVNEAQKRRLVEKIVAEFGANLKGRKFACWGLAFKPRTDDMREAPSLTIVQGLLDRGAEVAVHDPEALAEARRHFGDRVSYHRTNYETLEGADALLIVTEWSEFRRPDFARMKQLMKRPLIFDGRNLYEPDVMREQGFAYFPIGRAIVRPAV